MGVEQREGRPGNGPGPAITRVFAIINPVSGAGLDRSAAAARVALVKETLASAGIPLTLHVTERAGHARTLAADAVAAGADLVIVWGGDGTVNEAGAALVRTTTALGLVPAGSGNGLAAALGVPRAPTLALRRILDRAPRAIDVGLLGDRPFFNLAGIGIDAVIAHRFNERGRGRRGRWPYIMIGLGEGWRYRAQEYEVDLDGRSRRTTALVIVFANGQEYGMGARISPDAKLDDGLLEATVVEDRSIVARFRDARHLATGSVVRAPRVQVTQVRQARITSKAALRYHVDGEPGVAPGGLNVSVIRGGLWVRG